MILLDAHVLIWMDTASRRLGRKSHALIEKHWAEGRVAVSSITFWEVGQLVARRRFDPGVPVPEWRNQLLQSGLHELPLDGTVATRALDLAGLPEDPADRFITATAIVHGAALLTADEKLLAWPHSLTRHDASK